MILPFAVAAAFAATQPPALPPEVEEAASAWGGCHGRLAPAIAARDTTAEEAAEAVRQACISEEERMQVTLARSIGLEAAARIVGNLRENMRGLDLQRVRESRGVGPPVRDEVVLYGQCVGERARQLADGPGAPAELAERAAAQCAAAEQAAAARLRREEEAPLADRIIASLRAQTRAAALRIIEQRRAAQ